jgi:hypothetical protein
MAVFVLPKWAKFNKLTRYWKLYQEFPARTQLFTRHSLENHVHQEVVALAPWHVQLWLVDADCTFHDHAPTTFPDQSTSVHVRHVDTEESIATLQQFSSTATAILTDLAEARPLIRTEPNVKTRDGGGQLIFGGLIFGLVDCAAIFDFVYEDFVGHFALKTRKSLTKTPVRLANGQRVTSSTICDDMTFALARHEFQRTFYVLRDLRAAHLVPG